MDLIPFIYIFFIGFVGKLYDDLTDLFFVKHERLLETIKTVWTYMILYFMFFMTKNQYDIFSMMFVWTFLPLLDWHAYTNDPYFFSLILMITGLGTGILLTRKYLLDFHPGYFLLAFLLYCICSPLTEWFDFELNGPIYNILQDIGVLPEGKGYIFSDAKSGELEVSQKKLITRCVSFSFLTIVITVLSIIKYFSTNDHLQSVLTSVIYQSLSNNGYFLLSILLQIYVLYFNKDLLNKHINPDSLKEPNDSK